MMRPPDVVRERRGSAGGEKLREIVGEEKRRCCAVFLAGGSNSFPIFLSLHWSVSSGEGRVVRGGAVSPIVMRYRAGAKSRTRPLSRFASGILRVGMSGSRFYIGKGRKKLKKERPPIAHLPQYLT